MAFAILLLLNQNIFPIYFSELMPTFNAVVFVIADVMKPLACLRINSVFYSRYNLLVFYHRGQQYSSLKQCLFIPLQFYRLTWSLQLKMRKTNPSVGSQGFLRELSPNARHWLERIHFSLVHLGWDQLCTMLTRIMRILIRIKKSWFWWAAVVEIRWPDQLLVAAMGAGEGSNSVGCPRLPSLLSCLQDLVHHHCRSALSFSISQVRFWDLQCRALEREGPSNNWWPKKHLSPLPPPHTHALALTF